MSNNKGKDFLKIALSATAIVLLSIATSIAFSLDKFVIVGHSMFPSISHGDHIVTSNKFLFTDIEYGRNDVVVIFQKNYNMIKRIVGLPGERLEINEGQIKIDGKIYYNSAVLNGKMDEVRDITLGPDEYYVLGDNRPYSQDSRHDGPIARNEIIGRAFIVWRFWNVP